MKKLKWLSVSLILATASANALGPRSLTPQDAQYISMTTAEFKDNIHLWAMAVYAGEERGHSVYVCAGNGSALTPGKIVKGNCYYANNGDERRNSNYFMLVNDNYMWQRASSLPEFSTAITTRDWDAGDFLYHCRTFKDRKAFAGKYLPGTGKCYYGYNGSEIPVTNANTFDILVQR